MALPTSFAAPPLPPPRQSLLICPGLPHFQHGRFDRSSTRSLVQSRDAWLSDPQLTHFIGARSDDARCPAPPGALGLG